MEAGTTDVPSLTSWPRWAPSHELTTALTVTAARDRRGRCRLSNRLRAVPPLADATPPRLSVSEPRATLRRRTLRALTELQLRVRTAVRGRDEPARGARLHSAPMTTDVAPVPAPAAEEASAARSRIFSG